MWELVSLEELTAKRAICYGVLKPGERQTNGVPLLRVTDISQNVVDTSGIYEITEELSAEFKRSVLNGDEVLISVQGTVGRVALCPPELKGANVSRTIAIIDPDERVNRAYMRYWLLSITDKLPIRGATRASLNIGDIRKLKIPLPPLAEQQRIVAKLDAAFAEIDRAAAMAQKCSERALRFYAHTVDAAFNEFANQADTLGRLSSINYGYTAKASHVGGSYKFLRITDIQENNVDWDTVPFCEVEEKKLEKFLLYDGDIVFARTGATTGKSFLVETPKDAVFASYLIRVSVDRAKLDPRYVMHYFQSASYWKQVEAGISGAAQGGFNATKLAGLKIPVLAMKTQKELIERLDDALEKSKALAEIYDDKKRLVLQLKAAILDQELQPPGSQAA